MSDDASPSLAGPEENAEEDGSPVRKSSSAITLGARCYGKMLKPAPFDFDDAAIGLPMTVRINRACDRGAPLVARKVRVYARRYEISGTPGPQVLLQDWTDVDALQYRLDIPWTAGRAADGSILAAGRYQIYSYSLNSALYDAWVAGDPYARQMSTRSDNTYVTLKDPGTWASDPWGSCSASCGGGNQTRANKCKDGGGTEIAARDCVDAEPSTTQSCGTDPCGPTPEQLCTGSGGTWNGVSCVTPEQQCMMSGGMWMGTYRDYMWWCIGLPPGLC